MATTRATPLASARARVRARARGRERGRTRRWGMMRLAMDARGTRLATTTRSRGGNEGGAEEEMTPEDVFEAAAREMEAEDARERVLSETVVKKATTRATTRSKPMGVVDAVRNPENIVKALVASLSAGVVATLARDAGSTAVGVGVAVVVIKALETLFRDPDAPKVSFQDSMKNDLKPLKKFTTSASVMARGVADSFDEVFSGEGGLSFGGAAEVAEPTVPAQKTTVTDTAEITKTLITEMKVETNEMVEEVNPTIASTPAKTKDEATWMNALLNMSYSEQVIEDIRVMDANSVEAANSKRLGYKFTPAEPQKMPTTEYSWASEERDYDVERYEGMDRAGALSAQVSSVQTTTTSTAVAVEAKSAKTTAGVEPGELIATMNEADGDYSSFRNRTRSALGLPQIQEEENKQEKNNTAARKFSWQKAMNIIVKLLIFAIVAALAHGVRRQFLA
ncbi:unnamed product [Ostreococcus tauri]|uniref:Unnamed product n=1 Tax=Ostreococcus tauri TaxID=70448 RepID=A0A090LYU2_OSTTA|nr:unnamed product [Ostreococcus tauri]CEF97180.1 unnamed product [Ostreococcus tauri]|eukprot:XP_003078246.2 unnamed product [Ostreococcus tauri]